MGSNHEKREKVILAMEKLSIMNSKIHPRPGGHMLKGWNSTRDVSALCGLSIYTTRYMLLKLSETEQVVKITYGKFLYWRYNRRIN